MSTQVQQMFAAIAPRYDLANDALSLGLHRRWRDRAVALARVREGDSVLDCATGTGDLALAFKRAVGKSGRVVGTDFCEGMLARAPAKAAREGLEVRFEVADAMALPYPDQSFEVASIAFGIRNVDDPARCLAELARVCRRVVVLEFGQPRGVFGGFFRLYARFLMPLVGQLVTGQRAAYEYLPRTAAAFPAGEAFRGLMHQTGAFASTSATPLLFGLAWIYVGETRRRLLP
jgi:demethylmenaquinone methyltransferase/2-methoxy-6-polyprenyl-1,4-benzoquinol methylase